MQEDFGFDPTDLTKNRVYDIIKYKMPQTIKTGAENEKKFLCYHRFYIEFIGDSITSGTGIFGSSSTNGSADKVYLYQDATSNYAFRTSDALVKFIEEHDLLYW